MATTVFIVDDHFMIIEGIRSLLQNNKQLNCIGHATTAASCMDFLQSRQPDVILMDINLPDMSGMDLCKEVKAKYPGVFVIGLSTFGQFSIIEKMLQHGASGYLLKNCGAEEMNEAIEAVMHGRQYLSMEAAKTMRHASDQSVPVISRREKEVLRLIADGLTNQEIADKIFLSVSTVDTHRKNLLQKMQARNTASLVKIAMEHQLI